MELSELSDLYRQDLPYSLEAEQTVLGALLIDVSQSTRDEVVSRLKPEYFYLEKHRSLFEIIVRMSNDGKDTDIVTLLNEAVEFGVFETPAEGKTYLYGIMERVPTVANIPSYCEIVEEKYYTRALVLAAREIIDNASSGQGSAKELLDSAEQKIYDIRQGKDVDGLSKISDVIYSAYEHITNLTGPDREKYLGARSGFVELDAVLTGLNKSDLLLIAARPGMGKTSFALNIATNVCRKSDKQVAVFSLEMSKEQLATRMLSSEALVNSNSLKTGRLTSDDWTRLVSGADYLSKMNMYLDDTAGITVPQMKAKLRRLNNLGLVVIDYLQLMSSARKIDNRVNEISEITRSLKLMAKELNVPVITLSQLSRGPEARTDHRPMLSDLRESGSIEQDADIVMFLYRDAYYNKESPDQNISECIVAKNRHGETGTINLVWDGQFTRFSNMASGGQ